MGAEGRGREVEVRAVAAKDLLGAGRGARSHGGYFRLGFPPGASERDLGGRGGARQEGRTWGR